MTIRKKSRNKGLSRSGRNQKAKKYPVRFLNNSKVVVTKAKFLEIRDKPDFLSMVSVGRALNALIFAYSLAQIDQTIKTAKGRRNRVRVFQITSSYMHEVIKVLESHSLRYANETFFEKAKSIVSPSDPEIKMKLRILKTIRDSSGFHLDHDNKIARSVLPALDLTQYVLFPGDGNTMLDSCFDISDTIDLNYWINEFRDDRNDNDTFREIATAVSSLTKNLVDALEDVMLGLLHRLELHPKNTKSGVGI